MKKTLPIIFIVLIALVIFFLTKDTTVTNSNQSEIVINNQIANVALPTNETLEVANPTDFFPPLTQVDFRVTKKAFGDYITPADSPIQPERFQGYHTGVDFEILTDELETDVPVRAICSGKLLLKQESNGYGGLAVQDCQIEGELVSVIYGHLKLSSITLDLYQEIIKGQTIGLLGNNLSSETDGERKHLHLAIHKGTDLDVRGYVSSRADLDNWLNPCLYVCQ
ncbi:M23 family metallopeptidase [Patescibacteria group bacterium]|nr:M23 family metallopeptidase [Patescibacteria group bacterium]